MRDYTSFEAALSFLPALPPGDVSELLRERALRLEVDLAQANGSRALVEKHGLPRLFWVEEEFRNALRETELLYVQQLIRDIEDGTLEGLDFWHAVHNGGSPTAWNPTSMGQLPGHEDPECPGAGMPGAGMPGAGMPGAGMPGAGMPGAGENLDPDHPKDDQGATKI